MPASWRSDPYRGVYRLIAFTQPARAAAFAQALWAVAGGFDHFPRLILWRHRVELRLGIEAEGFIERDRHLAAAIDRLVLQFGGEVALEAGGSDAPSPIAIDPSLGIGAAPSHLRG